MAAASTFLGAGVDLDSPYHHHGSEQQSVVVDTSSPFSSVKQAIAIYGERFLARKLVQPSSPLESTVAAGGGEGQTAEEVKDVYRSMRGEHGETTQHEISKRGQISSDEYNLQQGELSPDDQINDDGGDSGDVRIVQQQQQQQHHTTAAMADFRHYDTLITIFKRLEVQLGDARKEIKSLKDRESENEVALASMKAELHKCMSKIAKMEAANTKNVVRSSNSFDSIGSSSSPETTGGDQERRRLLSEPKLALTTNTMKESLRRRQTSISDVLSYGDMVCEGYYNNFTMKKHRLVVAAKRKPVVPLLTDIFVCGKKKTSSSSPSSVLPPSYDRHKDHLSLLSSL